MKKIITFSLDFDNGEADLTPRSAEILDGMINNADLLDYDLVSDMHYIIERAFDSLRVNYEFDQMLLREEVKNRRASLKSV